MFCVIILAKYAHPQKHACYHESFLIKQSALENVINVCCSSISSQVYFVSLLYRTSHSVPLRIPAVLSVFALRLLSRLYIGPHESPIVLLTSLSVKSAACRETLFRSQAFKTLGKFSWRPCLE